MKHLCPNCYQKVEVKYVKKMKQRVIREEVFEYLSRDAICPECGSEVPVKELDDERELLITQLYCKKNGLITIEEIDKIIRVYNVDKRQLPFIIEVGEHTIERYLKGQIPNERISNRLKSYLKHYLNFINAYEENKNHEKITDATKKKVATALQHIEKTNSCNSKIEAVALYIINSECEITNLALQKLLYYCDAVSMKKIERPLFENNCEAWIHGPVYPVIYDKYKDFGNERILDCDLNNEYIDMITTEEKKIVDYVLRNFGVYNGKILEQSTHLESPWLECRKGYLPGEVSNEIIEKELIQNYFESIECEFDILNENDVYKYMRRVG